MNAWAVVSIIAVIMIGWWLMRKNGLIGLTVLGIGVVAAIAAFGLTDFVSSIPPALGDGVATFISNVG